MAETTLQLPIDGAGQKLRMESVSPGGTTVLQQVVTLGDNNGNLISATSNRLQIDGSGVTQPTSKALGTTTVTGVTVTTTSGTAIASNASRKSLLIVNNSNQTVFIKNGTATTTNASMAIPANGGQFSTDTTSSAFSAIVASSTASITVVEDA